MGARSLAAHCRHDLAEFLRQRDAAGDRGRADQLDAAARTTAAQLGMALASRSAQPNPRPQPCDQHAAGRSVVPPRGRILVDRVRERGLPASGRQGDAPRRAAARCTRATRSTPSSSLSSSLGNRLRAGEGELPFDGFGDAGPVLDDASKAAYRDRLEDMRTELSEAEDWNDTERAARLRDEQTALAHELAAALGIGGRDRLAGSASERARVSVTRAIRAALVRVAAQSAAARRPFRRDDPDRDVLLVCTGPAGPDHVEFL